MVAIVPAPLIIKTMLDLVNKIPVEPATIGLYVSFDGMLYLPAGLRIIESGDIIMALETIPAMMPLTTSPETEINP